MASETQELDHTIAGISNAWAQKFISNRIALLRRKKMTASGELINSFLHDVKEQGNEAVAVRLLVDFEGYGRMLEMKKLSYDKWGRNAISRIESWIIKKGVQSFAPGFLRKYNLKAPPRDMVNRIAWGIAKTRTNGTFQRKPWYAKPKSAAITSLYNEVAIASLDFAGDTLSKKINHIQ